MTVATQRAGKVLQYLTDGKRASIHELADMLGVSSQETRTAVRELRRQLQTEDQNIVCVPTGWRQPWEYFLTGDLVNAKPWTRNRLDDAASRLESLRFVFQSIADSTDGRSADGRKARIYLRHVSRAIEDVSEDLDMALS